MKNKVYTFILMIFCCGLWTARAQDSTACNAQFTAPVSGNTVFFRAADSVAGVQHFWNFGDTSQLGFGPYPVVTHTYSHSGVYRVIHLVRDSATGCNDSTSQLVTIGTPPPPQCSVSVTYSHDSSQPNQPYFFFAQASLAGATSDSVTWTVNDTLVGRGDTLVRVLHNGLNTVCANLVTNLGCQSEACVSVIVGDTTTTPPPPSCSIGFTYSHDSTQANQPYTFMASAAIGAATSDSITWTVNDTLAGTGISLTRAFAPGTYTVCAALITNLGCESTFCQTITVTDTTGVPVTPPDTAGQLIRCFPNPAYSSTNVILRLDKEEVIYVRVYNSMGSEVEQKTVSGFAGTNIIRVPLGSLQQGIYYIQLQYGNEIKRSRIQKL